MNYFALFTAGVILIICPESHSLVDIPLSADELAFQSLWLLVGTIAGFMMVIVECNNSRRRKRKQRKLNANESLTEAKAWWKANAGVDQSDSSRLRSGERLSSQSFIQY